MTQANILVVDDESDVCEMIADWLSQDGQWSVDYTTEPLRALEQLGQGDYDVMVTDLRMPEMNGLDLAREARGLCPRLSVIAITGYASVPSTVEALRLGVVDYVQKPFRIDDIRTAIFRALSGAGRVAEDETDADDPPVEQVAELEARNAELTKRLELISREMTAMHRRLAGTVSRMEARCDTADSLDGERDIQRLLGMDLVLLRKHLPGDEHAIILVERDPERVCAVARIDGQDAVIDFAEAPLGPGVLRAVVKRSQTALVEDMSDSAVLGEVSDWMTPRGSLLFVPLVGGGEIQAVGLVRRDDPGLSFSTSEVQRAAAVAGEIGAAIETSKAFARQEGEAYTVLREMVGLVEQARPRTRGHARRMARCVVRMARRLGLDGNAIDRVETAAWLHDIGKAIVPDDLGERFPDGADGRPCSHADAGGRMLEGFSFLKDVAALVRTHHDPRVQAGEDAALHQVLCAAEVYHELTDDGRESEDAMTHEAALAALSDPTRYAFDRHLLAALEKATAAEV